MKVQSIETPESGPKPKAFRRICLTSALAGILTMALVLRVWGIGFGLPYDYHYDEHSYINTALKLGAGIIVPENPTGLSNILFVEYAGYYLIGRLLHYFDSVKMFEAAFRDDPTVFYLLGRLTSAAMGVASVLALYSIGKTLAGRAAGLIAAGFLGISFLHVRDSHYSVPDIALSFFVLLTVALASVGVKRRDRRYLYLAALAGGLAVAMKWTGLVIALPIGWAAIRVGDKAKDGSSFAKSLRLLALCAALFCLGFAIGSPQIIYSPTQYSAVAQMEYTAGQAGGFSFWQVDTLPGWLFYGKTLLYGMGPAALLLGIVGALRRLFLTVRTGDAVSVLILCFVLPYYLLMGSTPHYFARYALPLVPFVALFGAEVVVAVSRLPGARRAWLGLGLAGVLVVLTVAQPLAYSIQHDMLLTSLDTRTIAKEWIEGHIPSGAKIALDWPVHGPPLSTAERMEPYSEKVYDVTIVGGTGLSEHPIAWYREQGFDYLVASSFIYDIPVVHSQQDAERRGFYASLDRELKLVQEFRPSRDGGELPFIFDEIYGPVISLWERERPGPTLKLYGTD